MQRFILWNPREFSRLYNLHSLLVLELSLIQSHFLRWEFSAFSAADAFTIFPVFVLPGTHHCWVDRGGLVWYIFAQHLYTWINFSDLRELVNVPCAIICVRQTASLNQKVLHCHSGSVVSSTRATRQHTIYTVRQWGANRGPQPWESGT